MAEALPLPPAPTLEELSRGLTTEAAVDLWDRLPPVAADEMIGDWAGAEVPTGHPVDGLLAASRWDGKRFVSADEVHPLIHRDGGGALYAVNPGRVPMRTALRLPMPKGGAATALFGLCKPLHRAKGPHARLREVAYRGAVTAAMIYDDRPIIDLFKRLDAGTVFGLMDMRGMAAPYFFTLTREGDAEAATT